jgi:hypothetical protein
MPETPRSELRCEPSLRHVDFVDKMIRDISGRLPVELWRDVFKHACVDGGRTGCALSLVSRRIRNLSAGIRLQSVCVIDLDRLRSLLHILERLPEHDRRVRSLFIGAAQQNSLPIRVIPIRCYVQYDLEGALKRQQDIVQNWRAVYPAVLALIAPHVEVLAIHIRHYGLLGTVPLTNIYYPVLRDLSIGDLTRAGQLSSVPLLRRLHVLGSATSHFIDDIVGIQSLEHVRFSGSGAVHTFAASLSKSPAPSPGRSAHDRSTKLVIENKRPSFGGRCGNARRGWLRTYTNAKESLMQHEARGRFASITILERSSESGYDLDLAIKDWRDVVENGGEGAWGNVEVPPPPAGSARRIPQDTASIARPPPPDARERLLPMEAEAAPSATVSELLARLRSSPATISPEPAPPPPTNPPPIVSVAVETEQPVQIDAASQLLHQPFSHREAPDSADRD